MTLNTTDPGRVATFTPFLSGGVPGDKGAVTGPNPQVQPNTAYRGARLRGSQSALDACPLRRTGRVWAAECALPLSRPPCA